MGIFSDFLVSRPSRSVAERRVRLEIQRFIDAGDSDAPAGFEGRVGWAILKAVGATNIDAPPLVGDNPGFLSQTIDNSIVPLRDDTLSAIANQIAIDEGNPDIEHDLRIHLGLCVPEPGELVCVSKPLPPPTIFGNASNTISGLADISGGTIFDDPDAITGLVIRLRASDLVYTDAGSTLAGDGDTVQQWIDMTSNAKVFSQTTAAKKPTFQTNEIDGKPIIRFDGVDDLLVLAEEYLTSTSGSVFFVYKLNVSVGATQCVISSSDEASGDNFLEFQGIESNANRRLLLDQEDAGSRRLMADSTATLDVSGGVILAAMESSGTAFNFRVDGTDVGVTNILGANDGHWFGDLASVRDNVVVGALKRTSESDFFKGDLAELLVYDNKISTSDRGKLETFLAAEYGVTLP